MSIEFDRESPGKFDSRTLNRKTLSRWTGRTLQDWECIAARFGAIITISVCIISKLGAHSRARRAGLHLLYLLGKTNYAVCALSLR